jgi:hypothetical protein
LARSGYQKLNVRDAFSVRVEMQDNPRYLALAGPFSMASCMRT